MQTHTSGVMEDFSKYLGINRTFSLICCMFWIFSPAEGSTISEVVGSRVTLHCNESSSKLHQLTWKMNTVTLFSFNLKKPLHVAAEAVRLNMNTSDHQPYVLVIERVQKSHTGNYTCEKNTDTGVWEQSWELLITEYEEGTKENRDKIAIAVAVVVPCVCCLIFVIVLKSILKRANKYRAESSVHSPAAEMEKTEDIYENCLEQQRGHNKPRHYNPRTH